MRGGVGSRWQLSKVPRPQPGRAIALQLVASQQTKRLLAYMCIMHFVDHGQLGLASLHRGS